MSALIQRWHICDVDHRDPEFFAKLEFVMSVSNLCAHEEVPSFRG